MDTSSNGVYFGENTWVFTQAFKIFDFRAICPFNLRKLLPVLGTNGNIILVKTF